MKKNIKNTNIDYNVSAKTIAIISSIIAIVAIIIMIIVITTTTKSLDRIIYNAKKEAEKTLISSGLVTYTNNIQDAARESTARPLSDEQLTDNTAETSQSPGTIVKPKENWNIETVTAISVGNGETVPVPIGFYYVGGNLDTGVIISDNEQDKYDGVIDKTTWEYTTQLKGNQFVWIPCKEEEYKKCEVWNGITQKPTGATSLTGTLCNTGWDKTTYSAELSQISKYGGFYVGRYEAGLANTITEFTSIQKHDGTNQVYNKEGIAQAKAGVIPWMFIDWNHAQKNAQNMYDTCSIKSGLITGTQWDVMLNKMVEKGAIESSDLTSSGSWGNYINNSIEYMGRMARAYSSTGYWNQAAFGGKTTSKTTSYSSQNGDLLTTGASKQTEAYHIFDVAGNVFEWTDECSLYKANTPNETNDQYYVFRGGSCNYSFATNPACYRYGAYTSNYTFFYVGFRVVLYVK